MHKIMNRFQSYFILGIFFFTVTLVLRCFDYWLLAPLFSMSGNPVLFLKCILNDAIWCGAIILLFSPLNYMLSRNSQSAPTLFFSLFFGILFLFQVVFVIFTFNSGKLLDKEILMRPFSEIVFTIKSYGSLYLYISLCGAIIFLYTALSIIIVRKIGQRFRHFFAISALLLSLSVISFHISVKSYNRRELTDRFTINRALYFLYDVIRYAVGDPEKEYNIRDFLPAFEAEYPGWEKVSSLFPFMRKDNTPDVLSPFFNIGKKRPNIVFVIVESLGRGISGQDALSGSFTPFLDSLASHSLCWENCITTTQRSFGILPSLLGSLPNGNTGFQFGDMPEHTSIVRLLNDNQYKTNMFYAGYYGFDCVMDFMDLQGVDYYAPYHEQYESDPAKKEKGTEWGYHDAILFKKSLEDKALQYDKNLLNIFITVTTHGKLEIPEKEKYIQLAHDINLRLSQKQQKTNRSKLNILASFVYADDALRQFINGYKKRPDFKNTIFIITGDHYISTFGIRNPLDLYRVPLIIYSPLLKTSKRFTSLVSTLDVTPSLWAMLRNQYHLTAPESIAWISDGLDTTKHFSSRKKVLLMQINRDTEEFIYNQYFYSHGSVYKITDNLELAEAPERTYRITNKFKLFKAVHSYAYNKQRLLYNPFQVIDKLIVDKELTVPYPEEFFNCLDRRKTNLDSLFSSVKIAADYKICFDTIVDLNYTGFVFECKSDNNKNNVYYHIETKYLVHDDPKVQKGKWYDVKVSREFNTKETKEIEYIIYFLNGKPPAYNQYRIKNQVYTIEGLPEPFMVIEQINDTGTIKYSPPIEFFNCIERKKLLLDRPFSRIMILADFSFRYDFIDTCRSPFIVFECRNDIDEKVFYSAEKMEDVIKYPEQGKWYDTRLSRIVITTHAKEIEYIVYFLNSNSAGKYHYSIKNTSIILKGFP